MPHTKTARLSPVLRRRVLNLGPFLDQTYARYHHPEFLCTDPLSLAHQWPTRQDQELVALLAALLAYGQVAQAVAGVQRVIDRLDGQPSATVADATLPELLQRLNGWRHRVTSGRAMAVLLWLVGQARRMGLSCLGDLIPAQKPDSLPITEWRNAFLLPAHAQSTAAAIVQTREFRHLLPDPAGPSACKRLFLFLRWMVRPADGLDLGLWNHPGSPWSPAQLLMPVDTHVLRISENLGLLPANSLANRATALRLTSLLRILDPQDPVRYDFSICRMGILRVCPTRERLAACQQCALQPVCLRHQRMAAGLR